MFTLEVGDVVEIVDRGWFGRHMSVGDRLEVRTASREAILFTVLSCSRDSAYVGLYQCGTTDWLQHCVRKVQEIKDPPKDTTTPLTVGDYV